MTATWRITRPNRSLILEWKIWLQQGYTNSRCQVSTATKFGTVAGT